MPNLPPTLKTYPLGPIIEKARLKSGINVAEVLTRVERAAKELHLQNNFKNKGKWYRAEKVHSFSKTEDLVVICRALDLPLERYQRRNEAPILLDAIVRGMPGTGDSTTLYCQPAISLDSRLFQVAEILVSEFFRTACKFVLVKREQQYLCVSILSACVLLLDPDGESDPGEARIDSCIRNILRTISGEAGKTLPIPFRMERLKEILRRVTVYQLKSPAKPGGLTEMAKLSPVNFWLVSDGARSSSFISVSDHGFLQCEEIDNDLMLGRFGIVKAEDGFKRTNPGREEEIHKMLAAALEFNLEFQPQD